MARLPPSLSKAPVDKTRLDRETLSEQQHERILAALTEVFAKRGYQAATVDHLIAAAKISMGSFYSHFEGKEEALVEVFDKAVADARARVLAAVPAEAHWPEQAYTGLHALLEFVAEEPMAARVVLLEAQTGGSEAVRRYTETLEEVAAFLRVGRRQSDFDTELPPTFEEATASGLVWLLQSRLVRGEVADIDSLFAEMAEVALEPYLGLEKTQRAINAFTAEPA